MLQRVSVDGGPVSTICDLRGDLRGASWGADGTIVFGTLDFGSGLWRVAASGGEREQLTTPSVGQGEFDHLWPQILPDNKNVVFVVVKSDSVELAVLSLDTGAYRTLPHHGTFPRYLSTGHLLYALMGNLWAVGFDVGRLETIGDPVRVLEGVVTKGTGGAANVSVSDSGMLVYVPGAATTEGERILVWVDREGRQEALQAPPLLYETPRVSPDGGSVVVEVNADIFVVDIDRGTSTRLTFDEASDISPIWSRSGEHILFASNRESGDFFDIYSRAADGTGSAERVASTGSSDLFPQSWSADGQTLVVSETQGGADLGLVALGGDGRVVSRWAPILGPRHPVVDERIGNILR